MRAAIAVCACLLAAPSISAAQQASYGQYLIVLDDSGSMDDSDPRRLVVMAALALAGALEDGDQVMIRGLNELAAMPAGSPAFLSPRDILTGREGPEGSRALSGLDRLGQHAGQTPCAAALARARSILNAVASAGAPQTLLFLTDGACNGGAIEPAERWLDQVRAHQGGRFRFVLLRREGLERVDPALSDYARRTGWSGEAGVSFDARALLRAFAEVLSFSRGLRYDEGGRIGLERSFAGARTVRVLAIHEQGAPRIELSRVIGAGASRVTGGPTFESTYGWSLRVGRDAPSAEPYAIRSDTPGAEVLVVPVYGRLQVEAIVAPCGDAPPLPWDRERAVRAGQPACAWARLVGDAGETVHPTRSFAFEMDVCTQPSCADATAMQAARDGTFHAELGAELPVGRHERTFRARGGGLASPVELRRGLMAMAFGFHRVALASDPAAPIERVELGVLPQPTAADVHLIVSGAFPSGASASIECGGGGECVRCIAPSDAIPLSDPFEVQVQVEANEFCPAVNANGRDMQARLQLTIRPDSDQLAPHVVPLQATLRYAMAEPIVIEIEGGARAQPSVLVPGPLPLTEVRPIPQLQVDGLRVTAVNVVEARADDSRRVALQLFVEADDCCSVGEYRGQVEIDAPHSYVRVPLIVRVRDPGFWTCPGKQIAFWSLLGLILIALAWIVRGFLSPPIFRPGAVLAWAESHDALLRVREGDEGWRKLERFIETKRGFRRPARVHLGGPRAPLPSLKRLADDGWIEATEGGGAKLVVRGPGVEKLDEATGWKELAVGEHPLPSRLTLRRAGEIYLQLRR